jgi:hypothetical protein
MFQPKSRHLQTPKLKKKKIEKDNSYSNSRRYEHKFLFSRNNETGCASQAARNSLTNGVHRQSKRMGREPENSPPIGGEVKNKWSWYILIFLHIFTGCTRQHVSLPPS